MKQITVRLPEELLEDLDRIAEDSGRSRAEVIRDELDSIEDSSEVERLRTEVERLQREKRQILEQGEENTELVNAVKEESRPYDMRRFGFQTYPYGVEAT